MAAQEIGKVKDRKYKEKKARLSILNLNLSIGITVSYFIIGVITLRNSSNGRVGAGIAWVDILLEIASLIVMWGLYFKNHYDEKLFGISIICNTVIYSLLLLTGGNEYIQFIILVPLTISILFYKTKDMWMYALIILAVNILHIITIAAAVQSDFSFFSINESYKGTLDTSVANLLILAMLLYAVCKTSVLGNIFNHDTSHAMTDEQKKVMVIVEDVLKIAGVIRENANASNAMVQELGESSDIVNMAVSQISSGSQATAESIQEQNIMTQSIQKSINATVDRSKNMVDIANNSIETVGNNLQVMNDLQVQSDHIATRNQDVIASMERLQKKTKEVQDILGIIYEISTQTNLLSLNASIESARAGEAGKGFAVVADHIRGLAEETQISTENITKIIEELQINAEAATQTVRESIEATNHQGQLITTASEGFKIINEDVSLLTKNIDEIDEMLKSLAEANNKIVDNISQISATTEEITASSQEALALSEKNSDNVCNSIKLLNEMIETSHQLDKYYVNK